MEANYINTFARIESLRTFRVGFRIILNVFVKDFVVVYISKIKIFTG